MLKISEFFTHSAKFWWNLTKGTLLDVFLGYYLKNLFAQKAISFEITQKMVSNNIIHA